MDSQQQQASPNQGVAFAFDIDGVLVNGKNPIPGARETLLELQKNNVPFIFLTNSGGVTEKENLEKLSSRLGDIQFDEDQIVQSHTPFQSLVKHLKDETVLVLGGCGDSIRELAREYGFRNIVTSSDLEVRNEHLHPFPEMTRAHHKSFGQKTSDGKTPRIAAIMVWSSPRDWCLDLQVTLDLLLSSQGFLNTRSKFNGDKNLPNNGYQLDGQPTLYFCNPDFEWSTKHEQPRLAQGAFREALRGIWKEATNGSAELKYKLCGKPTERTYRYGESALRRYVKTHPNMDGRELKTVYMIGDNPESDIAGANGFTSNSGLQWRSILVETGVHRAGTVPRHTPDHTAKDVAAAVEWALSRE